MGMAANGALARLLPRARACLPEGLAHSSLSEDCAVAHGGADAHAAAMPANKSAAPNCRFTGLPFAVRADNQANARVYGAFEGPSVPQFRWPRSPARARRISQTVQSVLSDCQCRQNRIRPSL